MKGAPGRPRTCWREYSFLLFTETWTQISSRRVLKDGDRIFNYNMFSSVSGELTLNIDIFRFIQDEKTSSN